MKKQIPPAPPFRLFPPLHRLCMLMTRYCNRSRGIREQEQMTGVHGWLIHFLYDQTEPVYQRDIEKRLCIRRSTVTATLNRMEMEQFQKTLQVMCKNLTDYESKGGNSTC